MHIQAIVRNVQLTIGEPAVVGRARVVERHRERPLPFYFGGRQVCQETRYSTTRTEYKRRGAQEALYLLWRELKRAA